MRVDVNCSLYKRLTDFISYKPSAEQQSFVVPETTRRDRDKYIEKKALGSVVERVEDVVGAAREVAEALADTKEKLAGGVMDAAELERLKIKLAGLEKRSAELEPLTLAYQHGNIDVGRKLVSSSLAENQATLAKLYHLPQNKDFKMRQFELRGKLPVQVMIAYIDGMIDKQLLTTAILQPLMLFDYEPEGLLGEALADRLVANLIPYIQTDKRATYQEVTSGINAGSCMVFINGSEYALEVDAKGYKSRGIGKAEIEKTVRGSQAAFGESLRPNTALLHSLLQSSDFVTELFPMGKINAKNCAVMYVEGIVNESVKREIIRRVTGIKQDELFDAGALSQRISANKLQFPEFISTERPDRVVSALMQGRVAIMVDGDPFAYIAPVNIWDFFHNPEDYDMRFPAAFFMRLLRYIGTVLTFILPSFYISIVSFHNESIPTELLLAVAGYRQYVPFPSLLEIIIMIFAFELIREATLRVPGQLGGSIGIVGAIILGQAAVSAKIVSPLLVLVVAITGLSSYVLPEYRLGFSIRMSQYILLLAGSLFGFVGIGIVIVFIVVQLAGLKSLGVPFLAPVIPKTSTPADILFVSNDIYRPDELNTKRVQKKVSREDMWVKQPPARKEDE